MSKLDKIVIKIALLEDKLFHMSSYASIEEREQVLKSIRRLEKSIGFAK